MEHAQRNPSAMKPINGTGLRGNISKAFAASGDQLLFVIDGTGTGGGYRGAVFLFLVRNRTATTL